MSNDSEAQTIAPTEPMVAQPDTMEPNTSIGPYTLVRQLGAGGMGVVWEAEEVESGRRVALKLLARSMTSDQQTLDRFLREGQLAAQLSHPRTTFVYSASEFDGAPYIVMELMPGDTLQDLLNEQGSLAVNDAVDYMIDIIDGLQAAHKKGVIHRDVKPSNCFLDSDGRAKVGDFGLSRPLVADGSLTQTGTFLGTPLFAAPEQIRGANVDERTDIYSVGATLYTLIAGRPPFTGDALNVTAQIISDPPPSIRSINSEVPRELDKILAKCLEKDPELRYQNLEQLRVALSPFATGGTSTADVGRRVGAFMIDTLVVGLVCQMVLVPIGMYYGMKLQTTADPDSVGESLRLVRFFGGVGSWLFGVCYFAILEGHRGQTIGKYLMKLRTVDSNGEPPGYARAFARALALPGGFGVENLAHIWFFLYLSPFQQGIDEISILYLTNSLFEYSPLFVCVAFMRKQNGYRGLHEFLSGTRVARIHTSASSDSRLNVPVIQPSTDEEESSNFGPFRPIGKLGSAGDSDVLLARDDVLDREVWLFTSGEDVDISSARLSNRRPGRAKWLQGGEADGQQWNAFEAVNGAPLPIIVQRERKLTWTESRILLADLVEELLASLEEDSLPSDLTLRHVWVDRTGHAKLLDHELIPTGEEKSRSAESQTEPPKDKEAQAARVFLEAMDACAGDLILPVTSQELVQELRGRDATKETLKYAQQQLRHLAHRLQVLGWDSRLGVLSMSLGFEWIITTVLTFAIGILILNLPNMTTIGQVNGSYLLMLFFAFGVGMWFHGGPAFKFFEVAVRRKNGRQASRFRCGVRNAVAWSPPIYVVCTFLALLTMGFEAMNVPSDSASNDATSDNGEVDVASTGTRSTDDEPIDPDTPVANDDPPMPSVSPPAPSFGTRVPTDQQVNSEFVKEVEANPLGFVFTFLWAMLMMAVAVVAPLISVLSPQRGLQDFLVGTRLVPR